MNPMPRSGSLLLCDYPKPMVRLICKLCDRKGQYRKETLLNQYGPDIALPDLLHLIANCERNKQPGGRCGARYGDLITRRGG